MNKSDALNRLLQHKIERQAALKVKVIQVNNLDIRLTGSKFSRWFGSSYLLTKRFLVLLLAIAAIIVSFTLLLYPDLLLENKDVEKVWIGEMKTYYVEKFGKSIGESILQSAKNKTLNEKTIDRVFFDSLEIVIDNVIRREIIESIRFFAILLLGFAIFLLYISRLTRKMHQRNRKISEAETVTQDIITLYKEDTKDLENEILLIKEIINANPSQNNTRHTNTNQA